jgi:hypothetical protein
VSGVSHEAEAGHALRCRAMGWTSEWELRTHANLPAVCLVTAAAMPPLCFACFRSFLAVANASVSQRAHFEAFACVCVCVCLRPSARSVAVRDAPGAGQGKGWRSTAYRGVVTAVAQDKTGAKGTWFCHSPGIQPV